MNDAILFRLAADLSDLSTKFLEAGEASRDRDLGMVLTDMGFDMLRDSRDMVSEHLEMLADEERRLNAPHRAYEKQLREAAHA